MLSPDVDFEALLMEKRGQTDAILMWLEVVSGYMCFPETVVALIVDSHGQLGFC